MTDAAPPATPASRVERRLWIAIVLVAFVLRLALTLMKGQHYHFQDTAEYNLAARNILSGHGPGSEIPRAPLYPALMAAVYAIAGVENFMAVRLVQLVLGLLVVGLTGWIGRRIANPRIGLMAAALVAVSPTLTYTSTMLYATVLYTLLLTGVTTAAVALDRSPRPRTAVTLGIGFALQWLTDQVAVAPIAAIVVWLAAGVRRDARRALAIGLGLLVFVVLIAGWNGWHRRMYGSSSFFLAKAQYVLYAARHDVPASDPRAIGGHRVVDPDTTFRPLPLGAFVRRELGLLRTQPRAYLHDYAFEFVHFFAPMPDRIATANVYTSEAARWIVMLFFIPVLPLALIGAAVGRAPPRDRALLASIVLATAALYAGFFTQMRYRVPVEPQLMLLAALGVEWCWMRGSRSAAPAPGAPAAARI